LDGKRQYIDISGNLVTVVKSTVDTYKPPVIGGGDVDEPEKPLYVSFRAFRENRRHVNVRVWDITREPVGTAVFLAEPPKVQRNQTPVCMLNVNLADAEEGQIIGSVTPAADTTELCRKLAALPAADSMSVMLLLLMSPLLLASLLDCVRLTDLCTSMSLSLSPLPLASLLDCIRLTVLCTHDVFDHPALRLVVKCHFLCNALYRLEVSK